MSDENEEKSDEPKGPPVSISISTKHPDDDVKIMKCRHILEELLVEAQKGAYRDFVFVGIQRTPNGVGVRIRHTPLSDEFQMIGVLEAAKDYVKTTLKRSG